MNFENQVLGGKSFQFGFGGDKSETRPLIAACDLAEDFLGFGAAGEIVSGNFSFVSAASNQ